MKKEILHIESYVPEELTWIFTEYSISLVERIRILTVPHHEWGHNCHIEYVYVTCVGDRCVWMGGDVTPFDTIDSWVFRGNVITRNIFENLFFKQDFASTREEFHQHLLGMVHTYWPQLSIDPDVLDYCKNKDAALL